MKKTACCIMMNSDKSIKPYAHTRLKEEHQNYPLFEEEGYI